MVAASRSLDAKSIRSLAVATAVVAPDGLIIDANSRFVRLFGLAPFQQQVVTLTDVVAEACRSDVEGAVRELEAALRTPGALAMRSRSFLTATRAALPTLRVTIEICRQGAPDGYYLVSAAPTADRRRTPDRRRGDVRHPDVAPRSARPHEEATKSACPPLLQILSLGLRGLLTGSCIRAVVGTAA